MQSMPKLCVLYISYDSSFLYVSCQQGFKITKQGKFLMRGDWEQTTVDRPTLESYQTGDIVTAVTGFTEGSAPVAENQILFKRVVSLFERVSSLLNKMDVCGKCIKRDALGL
jgi:hypothetical protein